MFHKALVPLDGSHLSEGILDIVLPLVRRLGTEVTILHVLKTLHDQDITPESAARSAQDYLARTAKRLEAEGVKTSPLLLRGDPGEQILKTAQERNPDLIAMATHGWGGLRRLIRGSVAERVLRETTIPLLLANPTAIEHAREKGDGWLNRILLATDGSDRAHRIVPHVAELAATYRARVTLLHVRPLPIDFAGEVELQPLLVPVEKKELEALIRPAKERLAEKGVEAEIVILDGDPADRILEEAETHDLLALTTHGHTGLARWFFGSVAEHVLRQCPVPTLVLHTR